MMLHTGVWTAEQRWVAKQEIGLYKTALRGFIRDADLYHISPRPDGVSWGGIEHLYQKRAKGVVYSFRDSETEGAHRFKLRALRQDASYRMRFEGDRSQSRQVRGSELLEFGLTVELKQPLSSELIFIEELRSYGTSNN